MKCASFLVLVAAFAVTSSVGLTLSLNTRLSPVTRVVELLQGLAKQIKEDAKKEEDLFEGFVCWGKSVIEQKTASNEAAESRIEELTNYIADIEAGRIEFSSERVDLEKDIKDLSAGIEEAKRMRDQENKDFLQAEDQMTKAVAALDKAITVLGDATAGHETGVFLAMGAKQGVALGLEEGFGERVADAAALTEASQLGEKFLSKGDALFLKRLLVGEVPDVDWKKLNRKANFKKSYKARSGKIQSVLKKLQGTFSDNLAEARASEAEAKSTSDTLVAAKTEQLNTAQESLRNMAKENGARALTKQESQDEVDALTQQVENDKKFIEQTKTGLAEKKTEWKDRSVLRAGEQAAVGKAISILHSDDSRDLFKKSFESQSMLLQESSSTQTQAQGTRAANVIQQLARITGDQRLAAVSSLASQMGGHFNEVIKAVDTMITTLKEEEATDLETKETCEKQRMENSRSAIVASRKIDEMSDAITALKNEVSELERQIAENKAQVAEIKKQVDEATRTRADEEAAWKVSDAEDKAAADLVGQAKDVLEGFYKESGLMSLVQAPEVSAGEAPPPPPSTWEAPYGGKTEESAGIGSMLEIVKEDIEKDITHAAAAETKAAAEFKAFQELSDKQTLDLLQANTEMEGTVGDKLDEVEKTKTSRGDEKNGLDAVLKSVQDNEPGCNYATINYGVRANNRQVEIDGLTKAKAILSGGKFE